MLEDDAIFIDLMMEQVRCVSIDGFDVVFFIQIFIVQQVALIFSTPYAMTGNRCCFL